jgi:hypothetical protein
LRRFAVSESLGRPDAWFDGLPEVYRLLIGQADLPVPVRQASTEKAGPTT